MRHSDRLDALQRLDPAAYRWLARTQQDRLYRYLVAMIGDEDVAEELLQETFAALVDAFHRRRERPDDVAAYCFGVARNLVRRHRRRAAGPVTSSAELPDVTDGRPTAEHDVAVRQELERALAALDMLEDAAREVVVLRFVEDLSLAEIADRTALPIGTVKSHIHRARRVLRDAVVARRDAD